MTATETKPQAGTAMVQRETRRAKSTTVRVIEATELPQYEEAWWKLSNAALIPNACYEPWMLLPALGLEADTANVRFPLVFGPAGRDTVEPLWGFFPLETRSRCMKLPIKALAFWQHRWCYLTVPLVEAGHVWDVLEAFWRWFEDNPLGCRILDTNQLLAEGPFSRRLDRLHHRTLLIHANRFFAWIPRARRIRRVLHLE